MFLRRLTLMALAVCAVLQPLPTVAEIAIHRDNRGDPETLDPHTAANGWEVAITLELFTGLTAAAADGTVIGGAAHDWSVSEDGLTYTWHLRDGMTWSDGAPLTAADFVYSFRRILDPGTASPIASLLYPLANAEAVNAGTAPVETLGVQAEDDLTLVMTLAHPAPYLPELLVHRGLPVPRHVVEAAGRRWARPDTFVGNGAFVLDAWIPQDQVKLVRNPRFFAADQVALDALYFHPVEDLNSAFNRFRAGELDVLREFPRDRLDIVKDTMPQALRIQPLLGVQYIVFNTRKPPFDDVRVRRALSMTIDRLLLTARYLGGGEEPAYSLVHPATMGPLGAYRPDALGGGTAARMKRARDLLQDAGYDWDNPLRVVLRTGTNSAINDVMDVVIRMWGRLFIRVALEVSDSATLYADMRNGAFELAQAVWYPEVTDPQTYLYLLKSTSGPMNAAGYGNPAFDALLDEADRTVDPQERLALYREAEVIIGDEQPIAPLYYTAGQSLVAGRVGGWVDHRRNIHPGRFLTVNDVPPGG